MHWFVKHATVSRCQALALVWVLGGSLLLVHAEDADVSRWFNRHDDDAFLNELKAKWGPIKTAMTAPVENLMLPLEYHPNGRIKAILQAKKAQIFPDGLIFAEGVRIQMLTESGAPDGLLTAEGCLFDREKKLGYCEGLVSVVKDGDRLKGCGMYFSIERQFIKILSECEIRTSRMRNNFGRIK